jgi:hypothetical protein
VKLRFRDRLAEVSELSVRFATREATVHAVNGVSFRVQPGEVLCILSESARQHRDPAGVDAPAAAAPSPSPAGRVFRCDSCGRTAEPAAQRISGRD